MNFDQLNANQYLHSSVFYSAEFEDILRKIIFCFERMILEVASLKDDENKIRDIILIEYLKNNRIRKELELTDYLFDREVPEDRTAGRTDIKIQTINTFEDSSAYYIIECKRLNGINVRGLSGFNSKYIRNGLARFLSKNYSSYYKINGMIGFVTQKIDIDVNVAHINEMLRTYDAFTTVDELKGKILTPEFKYSYSSSHTSGKNSILIYHLMLDVSSKINIDINTVRRND